MTAVITMIAIASAAAIFFMVVRVLKGGAYGILTKTLASLCFIGVAFAGICVASSIEKWMICILFGLVFGLVGDIVLDMKVVYPENNTQYLSSGMLSFGLGHGAYLAALILVFGFQLTPFLVSIAIALPIAFAIGFGGKFLKLDYGKFLPHSIAYAFILLFMGVYSVALTFFVDFKALQMAIGMILFLLSDLVLSTMYFGGKQTSKPLIIVNHTLYYAAQICIAAFIFFI